MNIKNGGFLGKERSFLFLIVLGSNFLNIYTPVISNIAMENGPELKMSFLLYSIAMLVCQEGMLNFQTVDAPFSESST